jgi:hypothetical protein
MASTRFPSKMNGARGTDWNALIFLGGESQMPSCGRRYRRQSLITVPVDLAVCSGVDQQQQHYSHILWLDVARKL